MTIRTKESLSGFVASDPELTFTSKGDARLYARIGQPQARFEDDGTFTQLEPTFTDLVMFRKSAELAHEQFRKGDNFLAEGETRTYTGSDGTERDQFVASRIGHDNNITRYTVDRTPHEREAPQQETPVREQMQQALVEREAQLDPEPPAATASTGTVQRDAVAR
ncbi:single-stranded DNA-binding protein [Micrococcaceae sp. AOP34-BR2-30]